MAITGDRYVGKYEGHVIEFVRSNWTKTLTLYIDGKEVDWKFQVLPTDVRIEHTFEHEGRKHKIVAESISHFPTADDHIEIDGQRIPLEKVY